MYKRALSLLLVLALLLIMLPPSALAADSEDIVEGVCGDGLTWILNLSTGELTISGTGEMTANPWQNEYYDIITSVQVGEGVTSIADFAFCGLSKLETVTLPSTIQGIGTWAFAYSSLPAITLPENLQVIEYRAFCGTMLPQITIPASVATIEGGVFSECNQLKSIVVEAGNSSFCVLDGALCSKDGSRLLCLPEGRGDQAFTVPDGVTDLDPMCFSGWNLTEITLPASVENVGVFNEDLYNVRNAFNFANALREIHVDAENPSFCDVDGVLLSKDQTILVSLPANWGTAYIVPDTITAIEAGALYGNSVQTISLPSGLQKIGAGAFEFSYNLSAITIPDQVTTIENCAFYFCACLRNVTIGRSVSSIGWSAFGNCSALTDVSYSGTEDMWNAIRIETGNDYLTGAELHLGGVPAGGLTGTCGESLTWSLTAETWTLTISGTGDMEDYSSIEGKTAPWNSYADRIQSVSVEQGVTSVGSYAFYHCGSLTSVSLPDTLTKIGQYAFSECVSLPEITIPASVTDVGNWAFLSCDELEEIRVDAENGNYCAVDGVLYNQEMTSLEAYPWGKQDSAYTVPASVTNIVLGALSGAPYLQEISVAAGNGTFSAADGVLYNQTQTELISYPSGKRDVSFTIPASVTTVGGIAFRNCRYLSELTIGESVQTLNAVAVTKCPALVWIKVGEGVSSLPFGAFMENPNLRQVSLPVSLTEIGFLAFSGCVFLSDVYYAGTEAQWNEVTIQADNDSLTKAVIHYGSTGPEAEVYSGRCGDLTWNLNLDTGVLTISGQGALQDYASYQDAPWYQWKDGIRVVNVEEGVTKLGKNSLWGFNQLVRLLLPVSLVEIGDAALEATWSVREVHYAGTETQWNQVTVGNYNDVLSSTTLYYESTGPEQYVSGVCGTNLTWQLDRETGTLLILGQGAMDSSAPWLVYSYDIQAVRLGSGITSIADHAFTWCRLLRHVTIPEGVTEIGTQAFFANNNLQEVTLPESLTTLEWLAFQECESLKTVTIPANVTSMNEAFSGCSALEAYQVSPENPSFSATDGVLFDKNQTALVAYPEAKTDTAYEVPETVRSIASSAFYDCDFLTEISVPASVTAIESGAITRCSALTAVNVAQGNPMYSSLDGILYRADGTELLLYPTARPGDSFVVPDTVTSIGESAFYECTLTSVVIPDGVQTIGQSAFCNCRQLTSIHLPESLTRISDYMLSWSRLTEIEIPENVSSIGVDAFAGTQLTSVTVPEGVTKIDSYAFEFCDCLTDVYLPLSLTQLGYGVFSYSALEHVYYAGSETDWQSVTILDQNEVLLGAVFHFNSLAPDVAYTGGCGENLTWTLDPETGVLTVSGQGAMEDYTVAGPWAKCAGLIREAVLEDGVTSIGSYAFAGCTSLERVIVGGDLTSIGENAFQNCTVLTEVCFLKSVPDIADTAFSGCESVKVSYPATEAPSLPDSVTEEPFQVYAAMPEVTASEDGKEITVDLAIGLTEQETVNTICAVYDENGKLVGVTAMEMEPGVQSVTVLCENGAAYTLKVFLLDGMEALMPQCVPLNAVLQP